MKGSGNTFHPQIHEGFGHSFGIIGPNPIRQKAAVPRAGCGCDSGARMLIPLKNLQKVDPGQRNPSE